MNKIKLLLSKNPYVLLGLGLAIVVAVIMAARSVKKFFQNKQLGNQVAKDVKEANAIATATALQLGIDPARVSALRDAAFQVAWAFGVARQDNPFWTSWMLENDSRAFQNLEIAKNEQEASVIAAFYNEEVTARRNLKADIASYLDSDYVRLLKWAYE